MSKLLNSNKTKVFDNFFCILIRIKNKSSKTILKYNASLEMMTRTAVK